MKKYKFTPITMKNYEQLNRMYLDLDNCLCEGCEEETVHKAVGHGSELQCMKCGRRE